MDLDERVRMAQNMREYVTIKKMNKCYANAQELRKWKKDEILDKNNARKENYDKKKKVLKQDDRAQIK